MIALTSLDNKIPIFSFITKYRYTKSFFLVQVSYLEIYNERVKDLLSTTNALSDTGHKLKVREHPKDGPYVENLSKHLVMNYKDILAKMEEGNKVKMI